jgi:membrane protease YdiL (CAAX protease family)
VTEPGTGPSRLRVTVVAAAVFVAVVASTIGGAIVVSALGLRGASAANANAALRLVSSVLSVGVGASFVGRSPSSLGLALSRSIAPAGAIGVVTGIASVAGAVAIATLAGGLRVTALPAGAGASAWAVAALSFTTLIAALFEEIAFRVGAVGILRTRLSIRVALAVPAISFGLLHATNRGASAASVANTVLAGLVLGLLYLEPTLPRPGGLALATGWHAGWNATLALTGIPVSGQPSATRMAVVVAEDPRWSGGEYGIEASPATTLLLLAIAVPLLRRIERSNTP